MCFGTISLMLWKINFWEAGTNESISLALLCPLFSVPLTTTEKLIFTIFCRMLKLSVIFPYNIPLYIYLSMMKKTSRLQKSLCMVPGGY